MIIKAAEAGQAMATIAVTLQRADVVQPEGFKALWRLALELKQGKDALTWFVEVDRGQPILFRRTKDDKNRWVTPRLEAKGIKVDQGDGTILPFTALDIALEVEDDETTPLCRWHLDLANKHDGVHQSGPMIHLQYGGHHHGSGHHDHALRVPRWCHPPMEVALLCEVVAANFYEGEWTEFRQEPGWCEAISLFERLCYRYYLTRMNDNLSRSAMTSLNDMWASAYA